MREFATLIYDLDNTNKTKQKIQALIRFFESAPSVDKLWLIALFTGKRPKRPLQTNLLRQWTLEICNIPEWLFVESYSTVGDLGETISLLLPQNTGYIDRSLDEWMKDIIDLSGKTESEKKEFVLAAWQNLPVQERFIFNKLLGGSFRVGVSSKTLVNALAEYYKIDSSAIAHSIMGDWQVENVEFEKLIKGGYANTNLSKPYPFCLAYPIEELSIIENDLQCWQAEYKWDGIRGQIIKREGQVFIWSRGEELITSQFPELVSDIQNWEGDFVLDGEILAYHNHQVLDFSVLQKRLNRKVITKKIVEETPVSLFMYDLLEYKGVDIRNESLEYRRSVLEKLYAQQKNSVLQLPPLVEFKSLQELKDKRSVSRSLQSEGLMLKNKKSLYHTGRKKGDWWKWKLDPYTVDAVMIYAQKGSGRRSGVYSDYTFAVRDGEKLVTIAKAYSGLTQKEIQEISRFVNKNAIEKFGPVRTVKPELVFEIAFEGINWSTRHKAGLALRFPRIARWRKDKTVEEIDDLDHLKSMLNQNRID